MGVPESRGFTVRSWAVHPCTIRLSGDTKCLFGRQPKKMVSNHIASSVINGIPSMGDLQDPKMEVLYHIRPYFPGIFPYNSLT